MVTLKVHLIVRLLAALSERYCLPVLMTSPSPAPFKSSDTISRDLQRPKILRTLRTIASKN